MNDWNFKRKEICFSHLPQSQPSLPLGFASSASLSCLFLLLFCFSTEVSFKLLSSPPFIRAVLFAVSSLHQSCLTGPQGQSQADPLGKQQDILPAGKSMEQLQRGTNSSLRMMERDRSGWEQGVGYLTLLNPVVFLYWCKPSASPVD